MPLDPMDIDLMLSGGGDEEDWIALIRDPNAEAAWQDTLRRRNAVDEMAALALGRPWLAKRLLTLNRLLRRTQAALPTTPALVLRAPALAAVLQPDATPEGTEVRWGDRSVRSAQLGEIIYISAPEGGQIWYSTAAGDGLLTSLGWEVQEGDLPLLLRPRLSGLSVRNPSY